MCYNPSIACRPRIELSCGLAQLCHELGVKVVRRQAIYHACLCNMDLAGGAHQLQVLEENAELTSRLIDVALTSSHNDVFDAAFGGGGTPPPGALAQLPLGHWSHEEVQRRHKEATEEARSQPSHFFGI